MTDQPYELEREGASQYKFTVDADIDYHALEDALLEGDFIADSGRAAGVEVTHLIHDSGAEVWLDGEDGQTQVRFYRDESPEAAELGVAAAYLRGELPEYAFDFETWIAGENPAQVTPAQWTAAAEEAGVDTDGDDDYTPPRWQPTL